MKVNKVDIDGSNILYFFDRHRNGNLSIKFSNLFKGELTRVFDISVKNISAKDFFNRLINEDPLNDYRFMAVLFRDDAYGKTPGYINVERILDGIMLTSQDTLLKYPDGTAPMVIAQYSDIEMAQLKLKLEVAARDEV